MKRDVEIDWDKDSPSEAAHKVAAALVDFGLLVITKTNIATGRETIRIVSKDEPEDSQ